MEEENCQAVVQKRCSSCEVSFSCGRSPEAKCWCESLPFLFEPDETKECLCPTCLKIATIQRIENFVEMIAFDKTIHNKALYLPKTPIVEDIDFYKEDGNYVFTAWYHLKRGTCCENDCRHCPY